MVFETKEAYTDTSEIMNRNSRIISSNLVRASLSLDFTETHRPGMYSFTETSPVRFFAARSFLNFCTCWWNAVSLSISFFGQRMALFRDARWDSGHGDLTSWRKFRSTQVSDRGQHSNWSYHFIPKNLHEIPEILVLWYEQRHRKTRPEGFQD